MISNLNSQLNLFEQLDNISQVSSKLIFSPHDENSLGDFVILVERFDCFVRSTEAEKLDLIKVFALRKNVLEADVLLEKDILNDNLPEDSAIFYSFTDLWRLEYLMPIAYSKICKAL